MTTIKLNNYYPHLTECITLEVSEEIAVTLSIGGRLCDSYKRRKREHDAIARAEGVNKCQITRSIDFGLKICGRF